MDHPLDGVQAKYNRAKEQFDELGAEMDAFFNKEPKPHFAIGEFDTDTWEWRERFQIREEPPLRFGVILGDSIHNLRSALDHLIWQVTLLDGGVPDDSTQFPIASKSEAQFERMAARRIPGLSPEHRALVKQAQPYHAGNPDAHPLAVLASLSNADKHRIVNTTYSFLASEGLAKRLDRYLGPDDRGHASPIQRYFVIKPGQRLEHGTPWLRLLFNRRQEPPRSVKVTGQLTLGIAFGEVGLDALDVPKLADAVIRICGAFAPDFPEAQARESRSVSTEIDHA